MFDNVFTLYHQISLEAIFKENTIDHTKPHLYPIYKNKISTDLCYDILQCLSGMSQLSSVSKLDEITDTATFKKICKTIFTIPYNLFAIFLICIDLAQQSHKYLMKNAPPNDPVENNPLFHHCSLLAKVALLALVHPHR